MSYIPNKYLFFFTLLISVRTLAQDGDHLSFFLASLKQSALDSIVERKNYFPNGGLREKITVMHGHYYQFDIQQERYLRRTFIKVKETYNGRGALIRKDSLAPPEQGNYSEFFFDNNGKKNKAIFYERKGNYQLEINPDVAVFPKKDFERISEYSFDKHGKRTSEYQKISGLRFVVHQTGDLYDITDRLFEGEYRDYSTNKYATFEPKKSYMEIKIIEPTNDSVLCTLKYKYTNGFLNTTKSDEIRSFIIKNARVYATTPCIVLYDQQTKKNFVLNYNFERIIKEPIRSCQPLTRTSTRTSYYWICDEKCGLYSLSGKIVIPREHGSNVVSKGDYLKIYTNGRYSCVDFRGNVIIPYRDDIEDFTLYTENVAIVYWKRFSTKGTSKFYLNLHTRDTILNYEHDENLLAYSQWKDIKSSKFLNDFKVIQDTLVFLEVRNPKYYRIVGADRLFWWQKYVLKLPDSVQKKTDLLTKYPDFQPVEFKYALHNLKNNVTDTINVRVKALDGNPDYSISIDGDSFVNGYAKLEFVVGNSYQKLYSLLSCSGEITNIQRRYSKIEDVNDRGQAIVQIKAWKGTNGSGVQTYGVIKATGEEVLPCEYSSCSLVKKYGYRVFTNEGKWGLADFEGHFLIEPQEEYNIVERQIRKAENPFIEYLQ